VKVSYSKGVATHADPESCVCIRKGAVEALTGARAGQVLSRERKIDFGGPTASYVSEGNMGTLVTCESVSAPAWSETLCTYGSYLHGSREIPSLALENGPEVRAVNPEGTRQRCTEMGSRTG
jgi:RNA-directed DNA polymerase